MFFKTDKNYICQRMLALSVLSILVLIVLCSCAKDLEANILNKSTGVVTKSIVPPKKGAAISLAKGYLTVVANDKTFLAAGTNGRLDRIALDKTVNKLTVPTTADLTGIYIENGITIVSGTGGTILSSTDGKNFKIANTGLKSTIFGVTAFDGNFIACSEKGIILTSKDGLKWEKVKLETDEDLISIASNGKKLIAITKESDILMSIDMKQWEVYNFNKYYQASYAPGQFGKINAIGLTFVISGQLKNDLTKPFVMYSDDNEFWTYTPFDEINDEIPDANFNLKINSVSRHADQLVAACDKGQLLTITGCSTCNKLAGVQDENLNDLASIDGKLLVVGDNFTFDLIDDTDIRYFKIEAEQAKKDIENGALIIDVRTDEEYKALHVKNAIHIPFDQIEAKLTEVVPNTDTKIIFYCEKGVRAQTALKTALELQYQNVYNMGGISNWAYETE